MNLEQFRKTQEQFYFAVGFFSRPMAALIARIPNPKDRLDILHNVLEEHGDLNEQEFHSTTFEKFLLSIDSDIRKLNELELCPQVRAFNSVLTTSCTLDHLYVGIGCIGIIEMCFAHISYVIGRAVIDRGWVKEEKLVHYKLHAEIDNRHAAEFFYIVEDKWNNPKYQYFIKQGLQLGVYIF